MSGSSGAQGPTSDAAGLDPQIGAEPQDTPDTTSSETPDSETLRREIEETREALGDTAEALAQKADLKGRGEREGRRPQGTVPSAPGGRQG
jgi:hypothetical protein